MKKSKMRYNKNIISSELMLELFQRAKENDCTYIDGINILHIFQLAYYCGLTRKEILSLRIKDILMDDVIINNHLNINNNTIILSSTVKSILEDHIKYMKYAGYNTSKSAYLFQAPRSRGKKQSNMARTKKFKRDINIIAGSLIKKNIITNIRHAGIQEYYNKISREMKEKESITATSIFARCTKEWLRNIIIIKGNKTRLREGA